MDPQTVAGLDLSMPSPAYIFGIILFSLIGFAAYRYGKSTDRSTTRWLGVVIMLYPYFTGSSTLLLYLVGGALTAAAILWKD